MKIIDLFAGAGGLSEGFRSSNFDILFHVEMNIEAAQTLKTREAYYYLKNNNQLNVYKEYLMGRISQKEFYSYVPDYVLGKVLNIEISDKTVSMMFKEIDKKLEGENLDGIIGGPPCQAFSLMGRKVNLLKKHEDERIYLYQHYVKFLKRYKPKFFIFENVKGLKSFKDETGELLLPIIIKSFEDSGYIVNEKIIDCSDYAVPQKRERLFVYGYKSSLPCNLFFDELDLEKEIPIKLKELFLDLPTIKSGESLNEYKKNANANFIKNYYRKDDLPLTHNFARLHNENDLKIYKIVAEAKQKGKQINYSELPSELKTHKNSVSFTDRYKALDFNGFSHTVVAHISKDGNYYIHPDVKQNRSITVREAARIQTFADDYYFEGSRTAAFKQIGNAVPPILSKKISKTIISIFK